MTLALFPLFLGIIQDEAKVYACPYCELNVWFNRIYELEMHVLKYHRDKPSKPLGGCCRTAVKENGKWKLKDRDSG